MKKLFSVLLTLAMLFALVACGNSGNNAGAGNNSGSNAGGEDGGEEASAFHIGIVTGTVSQSEDDRRGAAAFQAKYGAAVVTPAT